MDAAGVMSEQALRAPKYPLVGRFIVDAENSLPVPTARVRLGDELYQILDQAFGGGGE